MRLYKTFSKTPEGEVVSWQGSQTEASKARSTSKAAGNKAESQTVEVPTSKDGLLTWLNENVKS